MLKGNRLIYLNRRGKKRKVIKKDYQYKALSNPFFRSKKKNSGKTKSKKIYWFILGFSLLFGLIFYFLFFSPYLQIRNVEIIGLKRLEKSSLLEVINSQRQTKKLLIFSENNLLIFNKKNLNAALQKNLKLESIVIDKKLANTLIIKVQEREIAFIWRDNEHSFFSDRFGCLIREPILEEEMLFEYPVLTNHLNFSYLNDNDCLSLDGHYLEAMFRLYDELRVHPEIKSSDFVLSEERNSLTIDLESGPDVIFNTKDDLLKQVNKLLVIKNEQDKEGFLNLEYIDLRFGDLIYFK